jgi:hypothetical protein
MVLLVISRQRNYLSNGRTILRCGAKSAVHNKQQTKGLQMIINSLTILMIAGVGLISYFSFRLGQEVGYDQGLVDGRTAVRKYYEQVGR